MPLIGIGIGVGTLIGVGVTIGLGVALGYGLAQLTASRTQTQSRSQSNARSQVPARTSTEAAIQAAVQSVSSVARTSTQQSSSSASRSSSSSSSGSAAPPARAPSSALPAPEPYIPPLVVPPPFSSAGIEALFAPFSVTIPSFSEVVVYQSSSFISSTLSFQPITNLPRPQISIPQLQYNPALDYLQSGYLWSRKTWDQRVPRDVQNLQNKVNKSTRRFTPNPFKRPPFIPPPNVLKVSEQQQSERHPVGYVILKLLDLLGKVSGYLDDFGGEG